MTPERDFPDPEALRSLIEQTSHLQGSQLSDLPEEYLRDLYSQMGLEETPAWEQLTVEERIFLKRLRPAVIHSIDSKKHPQWYEPEDTLFDLGE